MNQEDILLRQKLLEAWEEVEKEMEEQKKTQKHAYLVGASINTQSLTISKTYTNGWSFLIDFKSGKTVETYDDKDRVKTIQDSVSEYEQRQHAFYSSLSAEQYRSMFASLSSNVFVKKAGRFKLARTTRRKRIKSAQKS